MRKIIQTGEDTSTTEIKEQQMRDKRYSVRLFVRKHFVPSVTYIKPISSKVVCWGL